MGFDSSHTLLPITLTKGKTMADKKVLTANVVLRKDDYEVVVLRAGEVVPDWAVEQLGDHLTAGVSRPATDDDLANDDGDSTGVPIESAPASEGGTADVEGYETEDDEEEAEEPYSEWTKDDLKAEAKNRGLSGYSSLSKEELVSLLEEDDVATEEG